MHIISKNPYKCKNRQEVVMSTRDIASEVYNRGYIQTCHLIQIQAAWFASLTPIYSVCVVEWSYNQSFILMRKVVFKREKNQFRSRLQHH